MDVIRNKTNSLGLFVLVFSLLFLSIPLQGFSKSCIRTVCVSRSDDLAKIFEGANTRYIIRYNHDLSKYPDGVRIGENSILEFRKGSLYNGLIVFNNTKIKSKRRKIFYNNSYKGFINVEESYPEWFGAVGNGLTDDTKAIQDALDVSNKVSGSKKRIYAVQTISPYSHCLVVRRDSQALNINIKDITEYTTSEFRGRGIVFIDNINGFSFEGEISSVNDHLPVSSKYGMSLEGGRAGIVCYGDCGGLNIKITCSNLYCGVFHGAFMYDDYLYRNGSVGVNHSVIKVDAFRVAYPIALNYANYCDIDVYGELMHRCVYLCGDNNIIMAQGRNYYANATPAHVLLLSNVLKTEKGEYQIVTSNHNNVTYKQLKGEVENLQEGAVFQFQELRLDLNDKIPHKDYSFTDNTVNLYCNKVGGNTIQHLYKSFSSNWEYDKKVNVECIFNVYGDISSFLAFSTFVFYANTIDKIIINNHSNQQLIYTFSYSGNSQSVYEIYGDSRSRAFGTKDSPFYGTLKVRGNKLYVNTNTGGPVISGQIYVEGDDVEIVQDSKRHSKNIHVKIIDHGE